MNTSENLPLALARHKVTAYAEQDDLMQKHRDAMDCRDCEDFLQAGINALKSLQAAECCMREAAYAGIFEFSDDLRSTVDALYVIWLAPCVHAEAWISKLAKCDHTPDNLEAFREACDSVREIVESRDWNRRTSQYQIASFGAEEW